VADEMKPFIPVKNSLRCYNIYIILTMKVEK